ncbi:hypothetical protein SS05631_d65600 (plasmid) [Sinorhizobium sp. CCBAU 05631]|nr:hypothetical protein SS05631_d65600 [Sinorhizobium sp. CCBAU 05631]
MMFPRLLLGAAALLASHAATSRLRELMQTPGLLFHPQGRDRYGRILVSVRTLPATISRL